MGGCKQQQCSKQIIGMNYSTLTFRVKHGRISVSAFVFLQLQIQLKTWAKFIFELQILTRPCHVTSLKIISKKHDFF